MRFSPFDRRCYPTTDVASGYGEWAKSYDDVVTDEMDLRLLAALKINWSATSRVVDLACGTGRVGHWLRERGVPLIDGLDLTPEMLSLSKERGTYDTLTLGDLREAPFDSAAYDVATASLVDEHLPDLGPLYHSAARLLRIGGYFVDVGYHPQFLMTVGMPTHFHRPDGSAIAIETHIHLLSEHVTAAGSYGFALSEMHERVVDNDFIQAKPKWERYRGVPISFAFVWQRKEPSEEIEGATGVPSSRPPSPSSTETRAGG